MTVFAFDSSFHFKDSSGKQLDYYSVGYLFLQENDMVGRYSGGCFTIIKKINNKGWLVEASENDIPATKTFYLKISKSWDLQTVFQNPDGFGVGTKMVSQTKAPAFRALTSHNLIVLVTGKHMKFTNNLDDTEESIRVLELKAIAAQPCM